MLLMILPFGVFLYVDNLICIPTHSGLHIESQEFDIFTLRAWQSQEFFYLWLKATGLKTEDDLLPGLLFQALSSG